MKITVQNASEIKNVQGEPRNANAQPVVCLDTGEVFASSLDAAADAGVHPSTMSWHLTGRQKTCKGKRYCRLSQLNEYLDELLSNMRTSYTKANECDELMAQQSCTEPVTKAIEVHEEPVLKATEKPAVVYKAPEVRKRNSPLRKAKEMIDRGGKIVSLFRAI